MTKSISPQQAIIGINNRAEKHMITCIVTLYTAIAIAALAMISPLKNVHIAATCIVVPASLYSLYSLFLARAAYFDRDEMIKYHKLTLR